MSSENRAIGKMTEGELQVTTIQEEILRREITQDEHEALLWQLPFDTAANSATSKMNAMLLRAMQSHNPQVKNTLDSALHFIRSKRVQPVIVDSLKGALMATKASQSEDGNLTLQLLVSASDVERFEHPFSLLAVYAHEVEHLKDMDDFDHQLPNSFSIDERVSAHWHRADDIQTYLAMEKRAHGKMSEMLIHHFGMAGFSSYIPQTYLDITSSYIYSDCDTANERWGKTVTSLEAPGLSMRGR